MIEKQARVAEAEANRARNLMVFEDQIHSRPARTWFQTEKEKQAAKLMAKIEFLGPEGETASSDEKSSKKNQSDQPNEETKKAKKV